MRLAILVMIAALPTIIYSGFLGWLELPLWQRLLMHMPFALLLAETGFVALTLPAWKHRWWMLGERIYFLVLSLTSAALLLLLLHWHLIGPL